MKKVFIILMMTLVLTGCFNKDNDSKKDHVPKIKEETKKEEIVDDIPKYVDDNNIVMGLYDRNGNTLTLYKEFSTRVQIKKDINTFQAFFSNDETVTYSAMKYPEYYYQKYNEVNPDKKYKVGFNLSYELNDGTKISQNIFGPSTTQTNYDYIEVYLYDSYKHRNDSFYSHIEENEYNDETFLTSIKLTAGSKYNDIKSKITLTVFTYDEDDFDPETNEYRGNSKYSVVITDLNKTYE